MRRRRSSKPKLELELEDALARVAADYLNFLRATRAEEPEDAKTFAARHAAAKSALSHLEQILKLATDAGAAPAAREAEALLHELRDGMTRDRDTREDNETDGEAG